MLQGELTSASAILDFLASPEALDLPGQVGDQNLSQENQAYYKHDSSHLAKISL